MRKSGDEGEGAPSENVSKCFLRNDNKECRLLSEFV